MTPDIAHSPLTEEIALAVESVPGVAFLRPGLSGRLRSTRVRQRRGEGGTPTAGVLTPGGPASGIRLSRPDSVGRRHVEIHLVALRQARALDVARAARGRVEAHLVERFPAEPAPARVTVTVTGQV
ncbi:hypothetical protein ACIOKD_13025 [Streptomyces sp. NPDC087844]|uniref:hypothetical protein n=1 Tax=Streptomyces sp. NPDC087844 TaxID=3365805 RepID=UPI0038179FE6